jgi:hypothetical protein
MSYIGATPTTASFPFDQFSGDGSTTAFTLTYAPASTSSIIVAVSGVVQNPNTYSVISTTLTFSGAPPSGTNNISVLYLGLPVIGVSSPGNTAYFSSTSFTATASQTTFTPSGSYQVGFINVIRNGSQLAPADYTATNGTTVVLNNACTAGDIVVIEVYTLTSISNALPLTGGTVTGASTFNSTLTVNGAAVSGFTGFKNRIINPGMVIDQRNAGAAVTLTAAGLLYPVDRWAATRGTGTSGAIAQRVTGSYVGGNALRVQRNNGDTATATLSVGQVIESANCFGIAGNTITRSFRARCGANFSGASSQITSRIGTGTGTDQSAALFWNIGWTGQVNSDAAITLTTSWQNFSVTITAGASVNQVGIMFFYAPTGTAGANDWFEIEEVQLERGSNATSFEFRDYGRELAMCQRYYEKSFEQGTAPANGPNSTSLLTTNNMMTGWSINNSFGGMMVKWSVTKRAAPTVTPYGNSNGHWFAGSWGVNANAYNPYDASMYVNQQQTAGQSLTYGHWTASAEL